MSELKQPQIDTALNIVTAGIAEWTSLVKCIEIANTLTDDLKITYDDEQKEVILSGIDPSHVAMYEIRIKAQGHIPGSLNVFGDSFLKTLKSIPTSKKMDSCIKYERKESGDYIRYGLSTIVSDDDGETVDESFVKLNPHDTDAHKPLPTVEFETRFDVDTKEFLSMCKKCSTVGDYIQYRKTSTTDDSYMHVMGYDMDHNERHVKLPVMRYNQIKRFAHDVEEYKGKDYDTSKGIVSVSLDYVFPIAKHLPKFADHLTVYLSVNKPILIQSVTHRICVRVWIAPRVAPE